MKNRLLLIICCLSVFGLFAQNRNYLLYTDDNIVRLKDQIKTDESIKSSWNEQYKKAKELLKKDKLKSTDGLLLGLVYRMTGEEKFASKLKTLLLDYTSKDTWEGSTLLKRNPPWQGGLGTSHTSYDIAVGFDCIYNYLTASEKQQIAEDIVRLGITPARYDWLDPATNMHTYDTMGHNWWSACVYMSGLASLAVRNEIPEARKWAQDIQETSIDWLNYSGSVLQNKPPTFDKDGGFYESVGYAAYGTSQYLLFLYAYTNVLPEEPKIESSIIDKIGDFFINTTYFVEGGKDLAVNFGDSKITANGDRIVRLLWNLGYQNKDYAWYINHVTNGEHKDSNIAEALILNPGKEINNSNFSPNRPKSTLYQDMGWATLRNSWGDNATMLAVKSGFTWNHAHADAGSYILFHNGKNLIIDSGTGSYLNPLFTEYYCQSEAHNVVMFDGEGQNRNDPYFGSVHSGGLHNLVEGQDFKYLLANATGPYSHILARNYRNFIWVGEVILVIDDLLAYEPGQFEWLLHYNGESTLKGGIDLTIKDEDAKVLVRPLFPETFPPGGERPHDFPEHMRLKEKIGYEDHQPDVKKPYWSISHFEKTTRTKFVTAITLETPENEKKLPVITKDEGKGFLKVSITQNGTTTVVYFNLLADGRLKHRNSLINIEGWETDAYLTVLKFKEGEDQTKIENLEELFIGHGSYLRRDGQVLVHALSKYTALVEDFKSKPSVIFQGQPHATFSLFSSKYKSALDVNTVSVKGSYDAENKLTKIRL
ncbi:heparinase II/III family protein [Mariniflexile sp. AS56]|uniref:heparinase II/III domain-containing protein n=1 Tax=Mariniflexile sp. AS56 TaxID=3063957 RepID=UPI0026EDDAA5|nr:heparinase II/III family protein [Mariniflexile sp. AS56]MDO7171593.1 heparinase II/III family protein [Mariniflexile sp. AS56]